MPDLISKFTNAITGMQTTLLGLLGAVSVTAIIILVIIYNGSSGKDSERQETLKRILKVLAAVVIGCSAALLVNWARGI